MDAWVVARLQTGVRHLLSVGVVCLQPCAWTARHPFLARLICRQLSQAVLLMIIPHCCCRGNIDMRLSDYQGALADFRKAADLAPGLAGTAGRRLPAACCIMATAP